MSTVIQRLSQELAKQEIPAILSDAEFMKYTIHDQNIKLTLFAKQTFKEALAVFTGIVEWKSAGDYTTPYGYIRKIEFEGGECAALFIARSKMKSISGIRSACLFSDFGNEPCFIKENAEVDITLNILSNQKGISLELTLVDAIQFPNFIVATYLDETVVVDQYHNLFKASNSVHRVLYDRYDTAARTMAGIKEEEGIARPSFVDLREKHRFEKSVKTNKTPMENLAPGMHFLETGMVASDPFVKKGWCRPPVSDLDTEFADCLSASEHEVVFFNEDMDMLLHQYQGNAYISFTDTGYKFKESSTDVPEVLNNRELDILNNTANILDIMKQMAVEGRGIDVVRYHEGFMAFHLTRKNGKKMVTYFLPNFKLSPTDMYKSLPFILEMTKDSTDLRVLREMCFS